MRTAPLRQKNIVYRSRLHLTLPEVERLIQVAELRGRHPQRDQALLLLMFRHGLRATEASNLRWDAVMLDVAEIAITRVKGSISGVHSLQPDEMELLQAVRKQYPGKAYVFQSERGCKLKEKSIASIVTACSRLAELSVKATPHMLRHACGYYLANQGLDTRLIQEWLGHAAIANTAKYTAMAPGRFKSIKWN